MTFPADLRERIASPDAEVAVLGGMLIDRHAAGKVARSLAPETFADDANARLFRALSRLVDRGESTDVVALSEELKRTDDLEAVGGFDYLAVLLDAVPSAVGIESHVKLIEDRARQRRLARLGRNLTRSAEELGDPDSILSEARDELRREQRGSRSRFTLLSEEQVNAIPAPDRLLGDILLRGSLAGLIGPPEAGKSFLLLDWALCVESGLAWIGRPAHPGPVVFVSAEGSGGLGARVRAWRDYTQAPRNGQGLHFVTEPVELMDPVQTGRFLVDLERQLSTPPALIIFDTLARCMIGGDENSSADMGLFIRGADRIREETGATVLIAHHPNASGERERGSTALRGAVDTLLTLKPEGSLRSLRCEKQKDLPHFDPIFLRLRPHAGSAVLTPARGGGVSAMLYTPQELEILRLLRGAALEEGLTTTQWRGLAPVADSTFFEYRKSLLEKGLVERDRVGRGALFRITDKGTEALEGLLR